MADDDGFLRWFVPWKGTRPDDTPIGWYTLDDLEAAFHAGHHATDDRPGQSFVPPEEAQRATRPAGPVPEQD